MVVVLQYESSSLRYDGQFIFKWHQHTPGPPSAIGWTLAISRPYGPDALRTFAPEATMMVYRSQGTHKVL